MGYQTLNRRHDYGAVLGFIKQYKKEHDGIAPSTEEIMVACEIPSKSTVRNILRNLERHSHIKLPDPTGPKASRMIEIVGGQWVDTTSQFIITDELRLWLALENGSLTEKHIADLVGVDQLELRTRHSDFMSANGGKSATELMLARSRASIEIDQREG